MLARYARKQRLAHDVHEARGLLRGRVAAWAGFDLLAPRGLHHAKEVLRVEEAKGVFDVLADPHAPADLGEVQVDLAALRQRADRQVKRALEKVYGVAGEPVFSNSE